MSLRTSIAAAVGVARVVLGSLALTSKILSDKYWAG